jgi:hypothetical protein
MAWKEKEEKGSKAGGEAKACIAELSKRPFNQVTNQVIKLEKLKPAAPRVSRAN